MRKEPQDTSREELIAQLRAVAKRLGRRITVEDVLTDLDRRATTDVAAIRREFGSVAKALKIADVNKKHARTEEELIADLQELARTLGRTPTGADITRAHQRGECPSKDVFYERFGSIDAAMQAAGLAPVQTGYTTEWLLESLRELARELGRTPTTKDIEERHKQGSLPGTRTYRDRLGGLINGLVTAGLISRPPSQAEVRQEMLDRLRALADRLGYAPTQADFKAAHARGEIVHFQRYRWHFGSLERARELIGMGGQIQRKALNRGAPTELTAEQVRNSLKRRVQRELTAEQVLQFLRELAHRLGHPPKRRELEAAAREGAAVSLNAIKRFFGTVSAALQAAGLDPAHSGKRYSDETLIAHLKQLGERHGRVPTIMDVNAASLRGEMATSVTYIHRFGSWGQALTLAGFTPRDLRPIKEKYTREGLLRDLRRLAKELGRPPQAKDLAQEGWHAAHSKHVAYIRFFGGIKQARKEAGIDTQGLRKLRKMERISEDQAPPKRELVSELRSIAQELKRPPTPNDVNRWARWGRAHPLKWFYSVFGNFTAALRAARLDAERSGEADPEVMLDQLRALYRKLKRPLLQRDVVAAHRQGQCSSIQHYEREFGSTPNAVKAAGASIPHYLREFGSIPKAVRAARAGAPAVTRSDLIRHLRRLDSELGRPPLTSDIVDAARAGKGPGMKTFEREFGTFNAAKRAAGIRLGVWQPDGPGPKIRIIARYTKAQMIEQMQALGRKLGRRPTDREMNAASTRGEMASAGTIVREFGSAKAAYEAAGFDVRDIRRRTKDDIIKEMRQLTRKLGRLPLSADIEAASARFECAALGTINHHFAPRPLERLRQAADLDDVLREIQVRVGRKPQKHPSKED
jgi:hypothetical protein